MTESACFYLENATAEKMGFAPITRQAHLQNWGKPIDQAIVDRIPGINPEAFMQQLEIEHRKFIKLGKIDTTSPINLSFLDNIKAIGKKQAILTSRSLREVRHLLNQDHPLAQRIDAFYHKDNTDFMKPDPRVFDKVFKDFSLSPDETVYIGDSLGDAISAKSAGMHFIAVLESGLRSHDDFQTVYVDFFATTLPEASAYIEKY